MGEEVAHGDRPYQNTACVASITQATTHAANFLDLHLHFISPLFALVLPGFCKYNPAPQHPV